MRTGELMLQAGVTRRALRLYEAKGLVDPPRAGSNGYRDYDRAAVERIHRIRLLQSIGFTLTEIRRLVDGGVTDWATTLRLQEAMLQERERAAAEALGKVRKALRLARNVQAPSDETLLAVMTADGTPNEEIMQNELRKFYSDEAWRKLMSHPASDEERRTGEAAWKHVIADAERLAAAGADPASPEARALVKRSDALIAAFTMGDPEIEKGLNRLYADKANWPAGVPRPYSEAAETFMTKARAAAKKTR